MSCLGIVVKFHLSKIHFTGDKIHWNFKAIYFDSLHLIRCILYTLLFINSLHILFRFASFSLQICFKRMRFKFVSNSLHVPSFNIELASNLAIIIYSSGLYKDKTRTPLATAFKISVLFLLFLHCAKKSNSSGISTNLSCSTK